MVRLSLINRIKKVYEKIERTSAIKINIDDEIGYMEGNVEDLELRARNHGFKMSPCIGEWYFSAAKKRLQLGQVRKAIKNFRLAARSSSEVAIFWDSIIKDCNGTTNIFTGETYMPTGTDYLRERANKAEVYIERLNKVIKGKWHGLEGKVNIAA